MRPREARRSGPLHVLLRALFTLAVALLPLAGLTPAAAAPDEDVTIEYHSLQARPRQLTICTGDAVSISVAAVRVVRRFGSVSDFLRAALGGAERLETLSLVGAQSIFADSSNPSVGSVSPRSTYTSMLSSPPGWAQFTFTATDQTGTTTVRIQQPAYLGPYGDTTVNIEVKRCKYLIEVDSEWDFGWGWQPHATERFQVEVTPDQNGDFDVLANVQNQVVFTQPFACATGITAAASKARVRGFVDRGWLNFNAEYDPVPGGAWVVCPKASGANQDSGVPEKIITQPIGQTLKTSIQQPATDALPHDAVANGTWPGVAKITVTTIPQ